MRFLKNSIPLLVVLFLNSCASGYQAINPAGLSYSSKNMEQGILLEYKYDLLDKKYVKKEKKNDVRLVAVKITNNRDMDIYFGRDITFVYQNGSKVLMMAPDKVFKSLRQKPATYLLYLLLTPMTFSTSSTGELPVGFLIGPGLASGNLITASSANKGLKKDLLTFNLQDKKIEKGETVYGIIGLRADNYDTLNLKIEESVH